MSTKSDSRAIIIGGGIAGLAAGIALRKAGYRIALYEQAERIEPLGAALSIWGNAMAGLDWMGCGNVVCKGSAPIRKIEISSREGRRIFGPVDVTETNSWLPMRAHLQSVLLDKLGIENCHFSKRCVAVSQNGKCATIHLEDGTADSADLLVVADGIHSRVATQLLGNGPVFSGYAGALGLAEGSFEEWPFGLGKEIWGDRERFGLFSADDNRIYWFYMRNADKADGANRLSLSDIRARAQDWPDPIAKILDATPENALTSVAIHARSAPSRLGKDRIICLGDAAHAMEPNQGQGACQAIEDGWALGVLAMRHRPAEILPHLERLRLRRIRRYMRDSHLVGRMIHSPRGWERRWARALVPIVPPVINDIALRKQLRPPRLS